MVIVDTSVWLCAMGSENEDAYRIRIQLEALLNRYLVSISDTIRFHVLQSVDPQQRAELMAHLNYLPCLPLKASTWSIAIQIAWDLSDMDILLDQGDAATVALALQNQLPLFTLNETQKEVGKLRKLKLLE